MGERCGQRPSSAETFAEVARRAHASRARSEHQDWAACCVRSAYRAYVFVFGQRPRSKCTVRTHSEDDVGAVVLVHDVVFTILMDPTLCRRLCVGCLRQPRVMPAVPDSYGALDTAPTLLAVTPNGALAKAATRVTRAPTPPVQGVGLTEARAHENPNSTHGSVKSRDMRSLQLAWGSAYYHRALMPMTAMSKWVNPVASSIAGVELDPFHRDDSMTGLSMHQTTSRPWSSIDYQVGLRTDTGRARCGSAAR